MELERTIGTVAGTPRPHPGDRRARHAVVQRWLVVGLALVAVALWGASFLQPWWQFHLFAPQYPNGLVLDISLNGIGGDSREINMLNHYIGMKGLDEAASLERHVAVYLVALVALATTVFALVTGRRWSWLMILPGLLFPAGFVADSIWWLYHFGHTLDPHAPLRVPLFTPQFFGWGQIGQFQTYAMPLPGFWLSLVALVAVVVAATLRYRVCRTCPLHDRCGATCENYLVMGRPAWPRE